MSLNHMIKQLLLVFFYQYEDQATLKLQYLPLGQ